MKRVLTGLLAAAVVTVGACTSKPAEAPAPAASAPPPAPVVNYTPSVSLNEMMVYVVDAHANEVWDAAMIPPKNDNGWKQLNQIGRAHV